MRYAFAVRKVGEDDWHVFPHTVIDRKPTQKNYDDFIRFAPYYLETTPKTGKRKYEIVSFDETGKQRKWW